MTAEEFVINEGKYFKKNGIYTFQSISSLRSFLEKFESDQCIIPPGHSTSLLDQDNDIDIIGKCANCGVEFHIHKPETNK
jgi:hypothetical protein